MFHRLYSLVSPRFVNDCSNAKRSTQDLLNCINQEFRPDPTVCEDDRLVSRTSAIVTFHLNFPSSEIQQLTLISITITADPNYNI